MELARMLADDRAVAPVIGVILVVAIAVLLATVVGVFTVGIGEQTTPEVPSVVVAFEYDATAAPGDEDSWDRTKAEASDASDDGDVDGLLTVTHDHGFRVPADRLELVGASGLDDGAFVDDDVDAFGGDGYYDSGDELRVWVAEGDTVTVVWRSPEGTKSAALGVWNGA